MIRTIAGIWALSLVGLIRLVTHVAEPVTIVVWHSLSGCEQGALDAAVARFSSPDPRVRIQLVSLPRGVLEDEVGAAIRKGRGPDLFVTSHERIADLATKGVIEPLTSWITEGLARQYAPVAFGAATHEGVVYGLPFAMGSLVLFHNRKLVPSPPRTVTEMVDLARKLTDAGQGRYGLVYEVRRLHSNAAWLFGFGGGLFDVGGRPHLDSPGNRRAVSFVADLCGERGTMPRETTGSLVTDLFNRGQAAMVIADAGFSGEIASRVDHGVALIPAVEGTGNPTTPFLTVTALQMSALSAHKPEAFEVMRYLAGREASVILASAGRVPVANLEAYGDPAVRRVAHLEVVRKQAERSISFPGTPEMQAIRRCMDAVFHEVLAGISRPDRALGEAQASVSASLSSGLRTSRK